MMAENSSVEWEHIPMATGRDAYNTSINSLTIIIWDWKGTLGLPKSYHDWFIFGSGEGIKDHGVEWSLEAAQLVSLKAAGRLLDGREWNEIPEAHEEQSNE